MIQQLSPMLNVCLSFLAMEDIKNTYERYEKDTSRDKERLSILRKQLSQRSSPTSVFNCISNIAGEVFLPPRLFELTSRVAETGLNIFLIKKNFDQRKVWDQEIAVRILGNLLCVSRVAFEIFKLISPPQNFFYYGSFWGFLAISEIASQILLLLVRDDYYWIKKPKIVELSPQIATVSVVAAEKSKAIEFSSHEMEFLTVFKIRKCLRERRGLSRFFLPFLNPNCFNQAVSKCKEKIKNDFILISVAHSDSNSTLSLLNKEIVLYILNLRYHEEMDLIPSYEVFKSKKVLNRR